MLLWIIVGGPVPISYKIVWPQSFHELPFEMSANTEIKIDLIEQMRNLASSQSRRWQAGEEKSLTVHWKKHRFLKDSWTFRKTSGFSSLWHLNVRPCPWSLWNFADIISPRYSPIKLNGKFTLGTTSSPGLLLLVRFRGNPPARSVPGMKLEWCINIFAGI